MMRIVAKLEEWAANSLMSKAARIGLLDLLWSSDAEYKCHTCIYVGTLLKYCLPQMYFVFALSREILHWSMYIGGIMDERWMLWVNAYWSNTLINFNICDFDIQRTGLIWIIFLYLPEMKHTPCSSLSRFITPSRAFLAFWLSVIMATSYNVKHNTAIHRGQFILPYSRKYYIIMACICGCIWPISVVLCLISH